MRKTMVALVATGVLAFGIVPASQAGHQAGPTAKCRDGSYSYSQHGRGTCSWHGGVAKWLRYVPA